MPIATWQHFLASQQRLYEWGFRSSQRYVERYGRDSTRNDPLKKIMHGDKSLAPLTNEQITTEVGSILVAGVDIASTVLTFTAWELARHPQLQSQLRQALQDARPTFTAGVPEYKDIERLELLDSIILESLRLHGPAVNGLPRSVPRQGANIGGKFVPGGVGS